jgi:hypothetical protein
MEFTCRRCNAVTKQKPYRVLTEDAGEVIMNMLVCSSCARLAKRLGLPTARVPSAKRSAKITRDPLMLRSEQQSL